MTCVHVEHMFQSYVDMTTMQKNVYVCGISFLQKDENMFMTIPTLHTTINENVEAVKSKGASTSDVYLK